MTLLEHVYAIRSILSKGIASDDAAISLRQIAHFLKTSRAILLEQKADKYYYISEQSFQSLCLDLEEGSFHNCCSGPDAKCKLLKSKTKLPKFLNTRWGDFSKVMTLDGRTLSKTSITSNRFSEYSITNKDPKVGWFIHDNHLYIINNTFLEKILLNSLFDDPEEVSQLNCPETSTNCTSFMEDEFPIDPDLVNPMYRMTLEFLTLPRPGKDNENDATDNQAIPAG
jgi:hypothetical protein